MTAVAKRVAPRWDWSLIRGRIGTTGPSFRSAAAIAIFLTLALFLIAGAATMRFLIVPGHLGWMAERAHLNPADFLHHSSELLVILLCATILFLVGLWDDKHALGPFVKLVFQFVVAFLAAWLGRCPG